MKFYMFAGAGLLSLLNASSANAAEWRPIDPAELAQKTPKIDPAADAEAIFWDTKIEDRYQGSDVSLALNTYVRIKIFTERGKELYSTVEIPRYGKRAIMDVAGRTIKPGGSVVELKKDSIFDRELIKNKALKLRGVTFALPNVEVGDIVEYRYKEVRDDEIVSHMRLLFQRDLPLWNVAYHVKPLSLSWLPWTMRGMPFQCQLPAFTPEPGGFFSVTMTNVAAFKPEPDMPPEDQLRAWVRIYYEEDRKYHPDKFWKEIGKEDFARVKPLIKPDDLVKTTAAELISGLDKPEDKLAALDKFCRTKIRNIFNEASGLTGEEIKALKVNKSAGDTLRQKAGKSIDVDMLFAAMATASGFDARLARVSDRGDVFFDLRRPTTYFLDKEIVAVKVNDKWAFYDPSVSYLENGMLPWRQEGIQALISDPKEAFFATTPYSAPDRSVRKRRANFKLNEDGTLEGTVLFSYTGHMARSQRLQYQAMTPARQEEDWKEFLTNRLSTAEVSDIKLEQLTDYSQPLVVKHKITVPGYATRTSKRILFQPAFFERNAASRFTDATRKWDVYFDYGWAEDDEVVIELPPGWELDKPTAPAKTKLGNMGEYKVELRQTTDGRKLIYHRSFDWGENGKVLIPAESYSTVKKIFDFVQQQDGYTLSLKQTGATSAQ
jgi:hypothetical protein